jgi:hypothetical protein
MANSGTTVRRRAVAPRASRILVPALAGGAVAVVLGAYGRVHEPSGRAVDTFGFSGTLTMKVWLTTFATVLALVQLASALRLYGKIGTGPAPPWVSIAHRASGTVAVLLTLPVAYHCLWSLGFAPYDTRTLVHSLLGCMFYGVFVAKMLGLRTRGLPGWALPVLGGIMFSVLVGIWLTSSLWFFTHAGFPSF